MSRSRSVLLFCAALLVALVVLLPLRVALRASDLKTTDLFVPGTSGTVWSGWLHEARLAGRAMGDIRVSLKPWSLLHGTLRLDLQGRDVSASLLKGRLNGILDARGRLAKKPITAMPGLAVTLHLDRATLLFSDGDCQQGSGSLMADAVFGSAASIRMQGAIRCDKGHGVITLANASSAAGDHIRTQVMIDGTGGYRSRSLVAPTDDDVALAWQLAGFRQTPAGLLRTDSGQLLR